MRALILSLILVFISFQLPKGILAQNEPTPEPGKALFPFGPITAQLRINSKTGQKTNCETASSNRAELIKVEIKEKFGIDFVGGWSGPMLAMACNKFAEISGTKFFDMLHYNKPYEQSIFPINLSSGYDAHVEGARNVFLGPNFGVSENFIVVLLHEMGHVLYHATPNKESLVTAARAADLGKPYPNGGSTRYGDNPNSCIAGGGGPINEDFAETTTYYLNPGKGEQTPGRSTGCATGRVPFASRDSAHYKMMNEILGDFE